MKQRLKKTILLFSALLAGHMAAACAQPQTNTGPPDEQRPESGTLFRHRWWNYYTRALDKADNLNFESALNDLATSLSQRDNDQRMARTYGMHFIDYFPHREMGVVHWLRGDLKAAEAELSRSIEQTPSAKARYHLDLVRKSLIQERGGLVQPPRLTLDTPPDALWTSRDRIRITGRATDPNYVSDILINGQSLGLEGGQTAIDFRHDLDLPQGCHAIAVEAVNLAGQKTRHLVTICVDSLGPSVVLTRIESDRTDIILEGLALDEAGVADLRIDEWQIPTTGVTETAFTIRIPVSNNDIVIRCRDRLGNHTAYRFNRDQRQSTLSQPRLVAGLQLAGLFQSIDKTPPVLRLQDWQDSQTVYMEKVVLTGSVSDRGKVVSLTINDEDVLPRPGDLVFFTHIMELQPGPNPITLVARDAGGNLSLRRLTIERRIPKALLLEQRLRLSIFAFEHKGQISPAGFAFQDDFIHEIVQRKRFQVVERQRLDMILQEQKINRSRLIDAGTAIRLGNLAAAQAVVAGSLVETRTGMEIIGRVIDSETGEILCTTDVYGEDKTLSGLKFLAQALALKLHREFPLVDGLVIDRQADLIITDLTLEKLRAQRRILVYAERPVTHPETGRDMGFDHQVLGTARVFQADDKLAKARLQPDANPAIQPPHRVITQ